MKTNAQKVRALAKEIDHNPLAFAFVLDSCAKMQKALDNASEADREKFAKGFISFDAWKAADDDAMAVFSPEGQPPTPAPAGFFGTN